jgi:hypothetical protein
MINCSFTFMGGHAEQFANKQYNEFDVPEVSNIDDPLAPINLGNIERYKLIREFQIVSEEQF